MRTVKVLIGLIVLAVFGIAVYVYSGSYPVGADVPHSAFVSWLLGTVRDRGMTTQSQSIHAPADLSDPKRLSVGAGQYAAMCSGCHLAPGYATGETWEGLYPRPPRFANGTDLTPAEIFWVAKHGLKMTGMPAWGPSHSDDELWSITAFVMQLGHLSPEQYKEIVSKATPDADMTMMPMPGGQMTEEKPPAAVTPGPVTPGPGAPPSK